MNDRRLRRLERARAFARQLRSRVLAQAARRLEETRQEVARRSETLTGMEDVFASRGQVSDAADWLRRRGALEDAVEAHRRAAQAERGAERVRMRALVALTAARLDEEKLVRLREREIDAERRRADHQEAKFLDEVAGRKGGTHP